MPKLVFSRRPLCQAFSLFGIRAAPCPTKLRLAEFQGLQTFETLRTLKFGRGADSNAMQLVTRGSSGRRTYSVALSESCLSSIKSPLLRHGSE